MNNVFAIVLASVFFSWSASAQTPDLAQNLNTIEIHDFFGRIIIETTTDDTARFTMSGGDNVSHAVTGQTLLIEGQKTKKPFDAAKDLNWRLHKGAAFSRFLDNFGVLTIAAPKNCNIILKDSYADISAPALEAQLNIDGGWIDGRIEGLQTASIILPEHGSLTINQVQDHLFARLGGDATLHTFSAGSAELLAGGSGSISAGVIRGDLKARASGSGDIKVGDIEGTITASISGSGDIKTGSINGPADFSIAGSGDIEAERVAQSITATIAGNGDIDVHGGSITDLYIAILGAGDFAFGGAVTTINAVLTGPGSVMVAQSGPDITVEGHGAVTIGENFSPEQ